jgi:hypothetical protein
LLKNKSTFSKTKTFKKHLLTNNFIKVTSPHYEFRTRDKQKKNIWYY